MSKRFLSALILCFLPIVCAWPAQPARIHAVSFNGNLRSDSGEAPQVSFQPEFVGYLNREALSLNPGEAVHFAPAGADLGQGTLQVWVKPEFAFPQPRIRILSLRAKSGTSWTLDLSGPDLILTHAGSLTHSMSCAKALVPGRWTLLSVAWNDTAVQLFSDNRRPACAPVHTSSAAAPNQPGITLGLITDQNLEHFNIVVRDLTLWNATAGIDWIRSEYRSQNPGPGPFTLWQRDLTHWNGIPYKDAGAKGGEAWSPDTLLADAEGIQIPAAGDYELIFRIKALAPLRHGDLRCEVRGPAEKGSAHVLVSKENPEIPKSPKAYQDFAVRFHAPSAGPVGYSLNCFLGGRDSMLLDTATMKSLSTPWQDVRRIADLRHNMGIEKRDAEAAKGVAWSNQNALNIGPYTCVGQPGRYRAVWRLKVSSQVPPTTQVLTLRIFSHDGVMPGQRRGNKEYGTLMLSGGDFPTRDAWVEKSIEFIYDGSDLIEFITHARLLTRGAVLLDTITVEPLR